MRLQAAVLGVALLAVGVVAALGLGGGNGGDGGNGPAARRSGPAATVKVTRQTLVEAVTLPGVLGYGPATPVTSAAAGTVTWLPDIGTTVRRGGPLLRADDRPVILLYGALPMYRTLSAGLSGADVKQFERNLSLLGYRDVVVDDTFSPATTAAVKRWQKSLKLPETGVVDRDRVIYAPDAVRISGQLVRVGAPATGDVLQYTGGTRMVTVTADRAKAGWAAKDAKVDLSVPGGPPTPGTVTAVTAAAPAGSAADGGSGGTGGSGGDGGNSVTITVAFAAQDALGTQAGAGVLVRHLLQEHRDVLTVPVNALLALAEGGYGVEVVTDRPHIVAVQPGLFADGRVEITGAGIEDGTVVGVPQ